ncbi:hypothetical protein ACCAA_390009 [Candidatus Accumulibacter aalborgensis]|uniref:Uncharacterized protein n=1 Tax=Candidatus Accumulibacter aalborgensis TaxID=1860102 RepID=A0A1A8XRC9_9PROT|nr:hypothetical protein ACCAA_390009 [Candidatus Accumulibacter aalborgensis]
MFGENDCCADKAIRCWIVSDDWRHSNLSRTLVLQRLPAPNLRLTAVDSDAYTPTGQL